MLKETNQHQQTLAPQLHYIITDHAGTPRELCAEDGIIAWRGEQQVWGDYRSHENSRNDK